MRIERVGGADVVPLQARLTEIYKRAWAATGFFPVSEELRGFAERLERHASNPDFRLCICRLDDRPVGFSYGYTSVPGGWWRQMIAGGLPVDVASSWFDDCFEFAELAVVPDEQGRGIGSLLHDDLLEGLPHTSSILSTQRDNRKAYHFYLHRDWTVIEDEFFFPNRLYAYVILGRRLRPARGT